MASLVRNITSEAGIGYGVNVWELVPPGQIRPGGTVVVAVIGDFPWGPTNTLTEVNTVGEFLNTFCPPAFNAAGTYSAMDALLNKSFPAGMLVGRIVPSSVAQATAAKTYQDNDPANSVTVTAKYPGALGNSISIAWTENADDATARDATVTIGTLYSATYTAVATMSGGSLVVTDPGDPYVIFTKHASGDEVPAVAAASALTGGADGTAVAGDYVGSSSSNVGIRLLYAEAWSPDVTFVAACPSGLIDTVNTGLEAFYNDEHKGVVVLSTPASQSEATAKTYVASYRGDGIVYAYPRVKCVDAYDSTMPTITVDPNAFVAALIAATAPWISPGGPRASAAALSGVVGLENEGISRGGYDALKTKGILTLRMRNGSCMVSGGVTTSITSGLEKIRRRRTTDYLQRAIATRIEEYVETPFDGIFADQALGPNTSALIGEITSFLTNEVDKKHIASFTVDPWGSATELDLEAGIWTIAISVRTFSDMDSIVLKFNVGDGVVTAS